jgi:hypothetical protein
MLCVVSTTTRSFLRLLIVSHTRRRLSGSRPVVGSAPCEVKGMLDP